MERAPSERQGAPFHRQESAMHPSIVSVVVALAAAAAGTAAAGAVDVKFREARPYADAGSSAWEEDANLQVIDRHLKALGQRWLPANHQLRVEVLELDLAGSMQPVSGGPEVRVLRGGADFPRMHLRYTLLVDGKVERSGTEWLTDLDYARRIQRDRSSEPLRHEKRMIDDWFKARFLQGAVPAG
jgi:hypothetical protein